MNHTLNTDERNLPRPVELPLSDDVMRDLGFEWVESPTKRDKGRWQHKRNPWIHFNMGPTPTELFQAIYAEGYNFGNNHCASQIRNALGV